MSERKWTKTLVLFGLFLFPMGESRLREYFVFDSWILKQISKNLWGLPVEYFVSCNHLLIPPSAFLSLPRRDDSIAIRRGVRRAATARIRGSRLRRARARNSCEEPYDLPSALRSSMPSLRRLVKPTDWEQVRSKVARFAEKSSQAGWIFGCAMCVL